MTETATGPRAVRGVDTDRLLRGCADAQRRLAESRRRGALAVRRCRSVRAGLEVPHPTVAAPRPAPVPPSPPLPPLTPAEAALVEEHIGLARHLAGRYARRGESSDDLEQVAMLALVKAARRFDPARGIPFVGYAGPSVLGELKRHFRDRTWAMRVSRSMQELYLQAKATRDSLVEETGVVPTVAEIAARLRCSPEEVMEAMEAGHNYRPASLEALDEIRSQQLPAASGGYEGALDRHRLGELITTLSDEERHVLKRRFFDEWTQRTIADELGVSQMHISRMLDRLLGRLRRGFED